MDAPVGCRSLVGWLSQFGVLAGVWDLFGPTAAAVHVGIACMTILFLTSFDYALHYGLVRQPLEHDADVNMASSGTGASSTVRYNPVTPFTSWNSAYQIEVRAASMPSSKFT